MPGAGRKSLLVTVATGPARIFKTNTMDDDNDNVLAAGVMFAIAAALLAGLLLGAGLAG